MQPGMNVGPYRILEQIGLGGMATIFKAYDPGMDRYVAIKIVSPQFAQHPEFRERFRREAKSIAKLEHPHIIPVFAFGEEGQTAYLVLRYMDTGTLKDQMNHHPMAFDRALRLIDQIAGALDYAHRNGVIHRDVKPSNVLVDSEGNAYLTDFGIAKIVEATVELTGTGTAMGTPQYMSPEQCRGDKDLTAATDTYSLGVILYQMVTGTLPFDAETPLAVIHQHLNDPLPPPQQKNPKVTESMERVLFKALAKDPGDRFSTTSELAKAFSAALSKLETVVAPAEPGPSPVARPSMRETLAPPGRRIPGWAWAAGGVVLAGAVIGGLFATGALELPGRSVEPSATPAPAVVAEPPTPLPQVAAEPAADLNPNPTRLEDPIPFGDHYYSLSLEHFRWDEAEQLARELGGHLVSINDQAENNFVHQTFASRFPEDELAFWLGLSDPAQPGLFEWISGEQATYFRWSDGQPDSVENGPVCVHMFPWGSWDDVPCSEDFTLLALIEFDGPPAGPAEAVVAPAADALHQVVSVDLGSTNVSFGLIHRDFEGDGRTNPATVGGREGRVSAPNGSGGRYIYFHVDDSFLHSELSHVVVSVEYFDQGAFPFWLDYDAVQEVWQTAGEVELTNSRQWRSARFDLPDAFFGGRQHEGADFRIGLGDDDLYVNRVTVALAETPMAEAISDPWGHVFLRPEEALSLGLAAGIGNDQTEPMANDQVDAVMLAVEQFGSIHGHDLELRIADSRCNPDGAMGAANELTSVRGIAAIVGTTCSTALREAMPIFNSAAIVFISPSATADGLVSPRLPTFNRTAYPVRILADPESFEVDPGNPLYQDFAAAFEARFGRPCCEVSAPNAYDAAMILLNAIEAVATTDESGSLVIPRQHLAELVRATSGWPGASGEITFNEFGDRVLP